MASASKPGEGQNYEDDETEIHVRDMHSVDDQTTVRSRAAQTQHISDGTRDDFSHDNDKQRSP